MFDYGFEILQGLFRSIVGVGYKILEFVFIDLYKGKLSCDFFYFLLDMLVDGSFQLSNMVIQVDILSFSICQC